MTSKSRKTARSNFNKIARFSVDMVEHMLKFEKKKEREREKERKKENFFTKH